MSTGLQISGGPKHMFRVVRLPDRNSDVYFKCEKCRARFNVSRFVLTMLLTQDGYHLDTSTWPEGWNDCRAT